MVYRRVEKNHGPELEDSRSVSFNVDIVYVVGGGTPYGRYMEISIVIC
jgi:hypothetical protein